jgi:hypothetical protein
MPSDIRAYRPTAATAESRCAVHGYLLTTNHMRLLLALRGHFAASHAAPGCRNVRYIGSTTCIAKYLPHRCPCPTQRY